MSRRLLAAQDPLLVAALHDLLWLRAILLEQLRRTPVAERSRFERRADRILGRCWADASRNGSVRSHDYGDKA